MKISWFLSPVALVIAGTVGSGCSGGYTGPDTTHISAASVHLKFGANSEPTFIDNGLSLTSNGALSGLGNVDLVVTLSATANVTANCTNHGGNLPPGQNPAPITVTGSQSIPASAIKNGNVDFSVTTSQPTTPIPGAPDCPNPNWSENITDLAFTTATITVEQPVGTVVLTVSCTFSAPTVNGTVSKQDVVCS
jgi:hypothetical protein